ncbi:hypothetical protein [Peromfec virus RodF8_47]|uniref:Uncharacterized protein n=1 Tax=Peromfec virus RodF8_47 TaxID=2929378 RepID=A0A976R5H5_9VIRU|nr:hypothetical protein [Peromfec virus RodF8_47]
MENQETEKTTQVGHADLVLTAYALGLISENESNEEAKTFLLDLSIRNPRVFGVLCDATFIRNAAYDGKAFF